jgi:hypothetical protein
VETLPEQFVEALSRIEIRGEKRRRAIAAHTEIRTWLETDPGLRSWGIDTVLIGSYKRQTGIHPGKDVDVFAKLTALDVTASPQEVFDAVADMLERKYGERAEAQRRSIKVSFDTDGDGFAVDVVPAVPSAAHWAIPQRDRDLWTSVDPGARWVETDPEKLGELTTAQNTTLMVGDQGAYVPTVKLVRQVRRHHLGEAKPGGLYFELLSYWAFEEKDVTGGSFAEILAATLGSAARRLSTGTVVIDPALGTPVSPAPEQAELQAAGVLFSELAAKAQQALGSARCPAGALWREILGENERGHCFPVPPGCDAEGRELGPVFSVASTGPRESSGFATGLNA